MKTSLVISLVVSALAMPMIAHAKIDSNSVTRDEVRAQLVQAEKDGTLHQSKNQYPDYNANNASDTQQSARDYGMAPATFSQSGARIKDANNNRLFEHH
ncbi:DUF4148 domain-containing protein [Burkholderia sp. Ac-20365]|jgi:hypothetical protein|uniref:DUF4148 domain-containing protein n=1 Tax=Burkholderia sp. Ac-20365 TaxID=2703897 RepID=UPI00197B65C4|nr:DUF4148 domain-containing protein [Burkholderia sp. Ac-20365]MBN3765991.1 DUF4148 domain-containing protein [Burkholderia sp. Ac-20365]